MSKKNILIITGTRAEYGLLKPIMEKIRTSRKLRLSVLVTGMHTLPSRGLTVREIRADKIPISHIVKIEEGDDMLDALAKEILGVKKYCQKTRPDLIMVLGDRDEAFAGAIVGGHLGIPVAHIHGGDLTSRIVDGVIRNAITKFANLHFTACPNSHRRVLRLGAEKKRTFLVGAPGLDIIRQNPLLSRKTLARKLKLDLKRPWLTFVMHPTFLSPVPISKQISEPVKALARLKDFEKIVILPNTDTGSEIFFKRLNALRTRKSYHVFANLPHPTYLSLLGQSRLLIGNSSSGIIESGFFRLPVVNIGERQKNRDRSNNVIDARYDEGSIYRAIQKALNPLFRNGLSNVKNPYGNGRAAGKIVAILEKTDFRQL